MGESIEFDPTDWVTAGAVGSPGRRTFYIQARSGDDLIAVIVEKGQVKVLADIARQLLSRVGIGINPDDLDLDGQQLVEPIAPAWRAGTLALGMDTHGERFVLEAEELVQDEDAEGGETERAMLRLWIDRGQLVKLAAYATWVVATGARPACALCGLPLDPGEDHTCPALNGNAAG